jgi:hypothetical protein
MTIKNILLTGPALLTLCVASQLTAQAADSVPQPAQPAPHKTARQTLLAPEVFIAVVGEDEKRALAALASIEQNWHESSAAMLIEMLSFVSTRRVFMAAGAVLEKHTGRPFDGDTNALYEWLWSAERPVHPAYAEFKALLYEPIDPRFREYFEQRPHRPSAWTRFAGAVFAATASRR